MSFRIGRRHASHTYPNGSRGGIALALAHAMGDNAAIIPGVAVAGTVLASVTVTPAVTGKFKLSASVVATDGSSTPAHIGLAFGHSGVVPDYPAVPNKVGIDATDSEFVGIEAENGSAAYAFVAPVGAPVTLNLIGFTTGGDGVVTIPAHGAQITVEELAN
jgi:hypothetical protein